MKTRLVTILIGLLSIVYVYPYNYHHDNLYYNITNEKGENILNFIEKDEAYQQFLVQYYTNIMEQ